jgi:hypothetical protein
LAPNDHLPNSINAVDLKNRLRDIEMRNPTQSGQ